MIKQLRLIFPDAAPGWVEALDSELPRSTVDSKREIASFCAQLGHESAGLRHFQENLFYSSPERLCKVWPRRFAMYGADGLTPKGFANPRDYLRDPQKLGNFVYANRMGNGPSESGDGWSHRGLGPMMLTGKNNQRRCGEAIAFDLVRRPMLLLMPLPGIRSAFWYWKVKDLDVLDDDDEVRAETKIITGGDIGLLERQLLFDRAFKLLNGA